MHLHSRYPAQGPGAALAACCCFFIAIVAMVMMARAGEKRQPHDEAVISWAIPAGYEESQAVGDPFLVTYQVQAQAPSSQQWLTIATTERNWHRAEGLAPGRWSFRVQALVDGEPLGDPSAVMAVTIKPARTPPVPRRPTARPLVLEVRCDCNAAQAAGKMERSQSAATAAKELKQ